MDGDGGGLHKGERDKLFLYGEMGGKKTRTLKNVDTPVWRPPA